MAMRHFRKAVEWFEHYLAAKEAWGWVTEWFPKSWKGWVVTAVMFALTGAIGWARNRPPEWWIPIAVIVALVTVVVLHLGLRLFQSVKNARPKSALPANGSGLPPDGQEQRSSSLRISVLDLCSAAEREHGWRISDLNADITYSVHFARCVAQGALDGAFKIWGSEKGNFDVKDAAKLNPLVIIPADYFEHYWIHVPSAIEENDNRYVKAYEVGARRFKKEYVNLQVERERALEWLRVEAPGLMKLHRGERT